MDIKNKQKNKSKSLSSIFKWELKVRLSNQAGIDLARFFIQTWLTLRKLPSCGTLLTKCQSENQNPKQISTL